MSNAAYMAGSSWVIAPTARQMSTAPHATIRPAMMTAALPLAEDAPTVNPSPWMSNASLTVATRWQSCDCSA